MRFRFRFDTPLAAILWRSGKVPRRDSMELLLTVEQAAESLQLTPETIRRQLKKGQLRGIKRGRQWRIPQSALTDTAPADNKTA